MFVDRENSRVKSSMVQGIKHERWRAALTTVTVVLACVTACYTYHVHTWRGRYWVHGYRTYRVVRFASAGDARQLPSYDPMVQGSRLNRAMTEEVNKGFASRGYEDPPSNPDLDVAFYATSAPYLDISGFANAYDSRGLPEAERGTRFERGTVIIDVVDHASGKLIWRGQGMAMTYNDESAYEGELRKMASRIIGKFPQAER